MFSWGKAKGKALAEESVQQLKRQRGRRCQVK